jgi:hypothetical protein
MKYLAFDGRRPAHVVVRDIDGYRTVPTVRTAVESEPRQTRGPQIIGAAAVFVLTIGATPAETKGRCVAPVQVLWHRAV